MWTRYLEEVYVEGTVTNCIGFNVKIEDNVKRNGKTEKNGVNLYSIKKLKGKQGRRPIHWKGKEVGERWNTYFLSSLKWT